MIDPDDSYDPDLSGIEQLYTMKDVMRMNRLSKSSIQRMVKTGEFPRPINVSPRGKRWRQSDVIIWQESL